MATARTPTLDKTKRVMIAEALRPDLTTEQVQLLVYTLSQGMTAIMKTPKVSPEISVEKEAKRLLTDSTSGPLLEPFYAQETLERILSHLRGVHPHLAIAANPAFAQEPLSLQVLWRSCFDAPKEIFLKRDMLPVHPSTRPLLRLFWEENPIASSCVAWICDKRLSKGPLFPFAGGYFHRAIPDLASMPTVFFGDIFYQMGLPEDYLYGHGWRYVDRSLAHSYAWIARFFENVSDENFLHPIIQHNYSTWTGISYPDAVVSQIHKMVAANKVPSSWYFVALAMGKIVSDAIDFEKDHIGCAESLARWLGIVEQFRQERGLPAFTSMLHRVL